MEFGGARKRGRQDSSVNGNGGSKKNRSESESSQPGVGSKSKPCTKFFSTSGCPFGEGCHFLHYVPGGYKAVSQMLNLPPLTPQQGRNAGPPPFFDTSSAPAGKSKMCSRYTSAEGCKFGDKCHYAHGEWELGRPSLASYDDPRGGRQTSGRMGRAGGADFGASATIKITIDGSLVGSVIGKGGSNTKQISRVTGVRLAVRDHESDPNLRNIELEGSFDQIQQANSMVRELIANVKSGGGGGGGGGGHHRHPTAPGGGSNLKTKLCERFAKGNCTFGDKCYFAHGAEELRTTNAV